MFLKIFPTELDRESLCNGGEWISAPRTGYGQVCEGDVPQLLGQGGHPVLAVELHVEAVAAFYTLECELKAYLTYIWENPCQKIDHALSSFRRTVRKEEEDDHVSSFLRRRL